MSTPIRRKFSYPIKLLPFPKAKAYPQRKKESPPTKPRNILFEYFSAFLCYIPKHKSAKFLMSIFVTFLLLTDPASMKPNPALKFEYI